MSNLSLMQLENENLGLLRDEVLSTTDEATRLSLKMTARHKGTMIRLVHAALPGKERRPLGSGLMTTPAAECKAIRSDSAKGIHHSNSVGIAAGPAADRASWTRRKAFAPQLLLLQEPAPPLMKETLTCLDGRE